MRWQPLLLLVTWLLLGLGAFERPGRASTTVTLTPTGATSISSAFMVSLGNPTGGTYTIGFGGQVTGPLPYNAAPSSVQAAVTSLATVGAGNATITGNSGAWTVTLADDIVNASNSLTLSSSLAGGSPVVVTPLINQQYAWLIASNSVNPSFSITGNLPVQAGRDYPNSAFVMGYADAAAADVPFGNIAADFNANSTQVEVMIKGNGGTLRILVDGVAVVNCDNTQNTAGGFDYPTDNSLHNVMLDFGGVRATRRIRVECADCMFCGASVGVNDTISAASPTTGARCFVLGDSYTAGAGGTSFLTSWAYQMGSQFDWDIWALGAGGTGYIHTGPAGSMAYVDRALPPANAWVADIGYSTSGTYTLSYSYGGDTDTTIPINYSDSLATIQSDLEALPNVGPGNVDVYGNASGMTDAQIIILFRNSLAGQAGSLAMNASDLAPNTGGGAGVVPWLGDIAPYIPLDSQGHAEPFYIVVAGGYNDTGYAPTAVQAAAAQLWAGLQTAFPTATLIAVGPWCTGSNQGSVYAAISNALESQAALSLPALNGETPFVDMQGSINGTGHIGMPENDGDADYYISADGTHPTDAGHAYLGQYVATRIQDIFNGAQPWISEPAAASPNPVLTGKTTQVTVLGADTGGESNLTYTWSALGPGPVSFSPNGSNAAKNATATFTMGGSYTITAQVTNAALESQSSSVSVSVYRPMTAIVVSPATWTTWAFPATQTFTATAVDQFGNPVPTQPSIAWSVLSGGIGSISSSTGLYHTGNTLGTATVKAKGGSLYGTAAVTVTLPAPTVATPASADPNPITGRTTSLSALGAYAGAGGAASLTYAWSATGPGSVAFSPNNSAAAQNTTATFSAAGSYTLTVTITSPIGTTAKSSIGVTVSSITTALAVAPGPAIDLAVQTPQQFTASLNDQFGNPISPQPALTWTLGSGSVGSVAYYTGLYHSGPVDGAATVVVRGGGWTGTTSITVGPPVLSVITPPAAAPNPISGTTANLSVRGGYLGSGAAANLTYKWSATGPAPVSFSPNGSSSADNSAATFSMAGTYTLSVTIAAPSGQTIQSSTGPVAVNQTMTSIVVGPGPSITLPQAVAQQFTAVADDQFGAPLATQPTFAWTLMSPSVGSVNISSGLYHSGSVAGTATVRAKAGGITGTSRVTVN